jgi:hypothetical protein
VISWKGSWDFDFDRMPELTPHPVLIGMDARAGSALSQVPARDTDKQGMSQGLAQAGATTVAFVRVSRGLPDEDSRVTSHGEPRGCVPAEPAILVIPIEDFIVGLTRDDEGLGKLNFLVRHGQRMDGLLHGRRQMDQREVRDAGDDLSLVIQEHAKRRMGMNYPGVELAARVRGLFQIFHRRVEEGLDVS